MHFLKKKKTLQFDSKFHWILFSEGPIDNKPSLIQVMALQWIDNKPLFQPVWSTFHGVLRHHQEPMSQ